MRTPPQRPEGALLEAARSAARLSQNKAASSAGMSGTRWRDIVKGYASSGGMKTPVRAPADTLARMAAVVGVSAQQLREVGRDDAAEELAKLAAEPGDPILAFVQEHVPPQHQQTILALLRGVLIEEDRQTKGA